MTHSQLDTSRLPFRSALFMDKPADRPLVVGHRGLPSKYPDNSLPGYEAALCAGADAVECDVRVGSNGDLILHHDRLSLDGVFVEQMSVRERQQRSIPTLDDLLALMESWPTRGLLIEGKTVAASREIVRRYERKPRQGFISFSDSAVAMAVAHGWPAGFVTADSAQVMLDLAPTGACLGPRYTVAASLAAPYLQYANVWTVNNGLVAVELARRGVFALTTDRADEILAALTAASISEMRTDLTSQPDSQLDGRALTHSTTAGPVMVNMTK